jgi:hypothetical protein
MKGLNPHMRMQLRLTGHHKFQELFDAAITLEYDCKSIQEERRKKARTEPKHFPDQKPMIRIMPMILDFGPDLSQRVT